MAMITSHVLNGTDGSHAGNISVVLSIVGDNALVAQTRTDDGGRLEINIDVSTYDPKARFQLVFDTGAYWRAKGEDNATAVQEIVLRFLMPDPNQKYHMPIIISPHSYSTWKSA